MPARVEDDSIGIERPVTKIVVNVRSRSGLTDAIPCGWRIMDEDKMPLLESGKISKEAEKVIESLLTDKDQAPSVLVGSGLSI